MRLRFIALMMAVTLSVVISCSKFEPRAPENNTLLDGALDGLLPEQNAQFIRGDIAFNDEIFTRDKGLGPLFVSTSCGSCHAGDGKGHPFTTLTRFGQDDSSGNKYLNTGGPQLQNRALPGHLPEVLPPNAVFSRFTPPANTGLGFLDAVSDAVLLALADPNDEDGDGISGTPNWISLTGYTSPRTNSILRNGRYIGRFGKKAGTYDLLQQTAVAYNQDMGINSTYEPYDTYSDAEIDPEVSNQTILDVVFYLRALKAPLPRDQQLSGVVAGKAIFSTIGCNKCHTPELRTDASPISALAYKTFYPYTDLLLHDMGEGLNDGYTEGAAKPEEWRTPPLWGLGLSRISQGGQYFLMHDGRAKSIEEAILLHGGEAEAIKNYYTRLSDSEKAQLLQFLESL